MGVERYWAYTSFTLSDRVTTRVNLWNGNLVLQYNAFAIPSRGLPLTLNYAYNSQTNVWTHTLNVFLTFDPDGSVVVYDGDGAQRRFLHEPNGSYTSPAGNFDILVRNADQTYTLTHTDQSAHDFDVTGRLTRIHDRHSNAITLTYNDSLLTQAQAAGGQTLTFAYTDGRLSSVTWTSLHLNNYMQSATAM
jgi:YD repeat-containing protein